MQTAPEASSPRVKRSVALVIRRAPDDPRVLLVQRPPDDEDLPDTWGLPAGSLRPGESWTEAVARSAREKLGLEVEVGALLNGGRLTRQGYVLEMRLYEARITAGAARVDQPVRGVTRYVEWKWGERSELLPASQRGSLCSRLFLEME